MKTLVFSGPLENLAIVLNKLAGEFDVQSVKAISSELYPAFEKCTVFLDASMKVPITRAVIAGSHNLALVVTATTGANHIDHNALKERNIPLLTLRDQKDFLRNITPAAEHSWLLLMACARKFRGAIKHTEHGFWNREDFPGVLLRGKTLGIIGLGRIGSWMSRYAKAFDMNVIGYDPYQDSCPNDVECVNLERLFELSDIISLHVNLMDDNKGMISGKLLSNVKTGAIFINTSRSELTDEEALVLCLSENRLSAVGVDVVWGEPDVEKSPLWQYAQSHDNVIISPHIGGFCPEAVEKVIEFSCDRIRKYFGMTQ